MPRQTAQAMLGLLAVALGSTDESLQIEQVDDCPWYTTLSSTALLWYDGLFDSEWHASLTPQKRCAYAGAVKDFEEFLDSHPISDETRTALAPLLLRQAFHSAGTFDVQTNTGGANGATIRFAEELEDPDNGCIKGASTATAAAFAKRFALVSQADAIVLGAYVALRSMAFPRLEALTFKGGRIDTPWHIVYRGRLPSTEENSVKSIFVDRMNFTAKEATALVGGAHNFGSTHAHCSGYVSNWTSMPTQWTVDANGSEFFRNLMENDWKFFEICSYLNGSETRKEKTSPFAAGAEEEEEEEEGGSGYTLAMYLNQEPYVCESQFVNSKGLMMLVSDFHLREAAEFKDFSSFYAADPTDQLALDFAHAFSKLVNLGLDRCGMFGGACAANEECVLSYDPTSGDAWACSPREGEGEDQSTCDDDRRRVPWWAVLVAVFLTGGAAVTAAAITWKCFSGGSGSASRQQPATSAKQLQGLYSGEHVTSAALPSAARRPHARTPVAQLTGL